MEGFVLETKRIDDYDEAKELFSKIPEEIKLQK